MDTFPSFLEGWLDRKQLLLHQLRRISSPPHHPHDTFKTAHRQAIIDQVLNHYHEFYEEKAKAAEEDVFLILSPPWLTTFERALLWVSWFRPSTVFRLAANSVGESMTAEQKQRMEDLKRETKREERDVDDEMASVQESVAAPPVFDLLRMRRRMINGEVSELDNAMDGFKRSMRMVVENADAIRSTAVRKVMEILSVEQTILFLAEVNQFQIHVRRLGLQRDARAAN